MHLVPPLLQRLTFSLLMEMSRLLTLAITQFTIRLQKQPTTLVLTGLQLQVMQSLSHRLIILSVIWLLLDGHMILQRLLSL